MDLITDLQYKIALQNRMDNSNGVKFKKISPRMVRKKKEIVQIENTRRTNVHTPSVKKKYGKKWGNKSARHWEMSDSELRNSIFRKYSTRKVGQANSMKNRKRETVKSRKRRISSINLPSKYNLGDQNYTTKKAKVMKMLPMNKKKRKTKKTANTDKNWRSGQSISINRPARDESTTFVSDRTRSRKLKGNASMSDIVTVLRYLPVLHPNVPRIVGIVGMETPITLTKEDIFNCF